ncbi:MAG: hypothetical protein WAT09_03185 [Paracoccaceae bacterium]
MKRKELALHLGPNIPRAERNPEAVGAARQSRDKKRAASAAQFDDPQPFNGQNFHVSRSVWQNQTLRAATMARESGALPSMTFA